MRHPTVSELIEATEQKKVTSEWDRREELMIRFNGLKRSTLNIYQKEMERIPEFKEGVIRPSHSVTWINVNTFIKYLKWKEANRFMVENIEPEEV